jgi:hypothetical protein
MKGLESVFNSNIKFKFQDVGVERPSISRTLARLGSNWSPQESGLLANGVYLNEAKSPLEAQKIQLQPSEIHLNSRDSKIWYLKLDTNWWSFLHHSFLSFNAWQSKLSFQHILLPATRMNINRHAKQITLHIHSAADNIQKSNDAKNNLLYLILLGLVITMPKLPKIYH